MTTFSLPESFASAYRQEPDGYDEMLDETGRIRAHWQHLMQALIQLGPEEVSQRHREALRLLRENGVTYNVYGDPDGANRPWRLDPVPLLVSSDEWFDIEAGLLQRAELLNLILADLYGPRQLIKKNLLPLELVYNHGGFLRVCDQVRLAGQHQLILYAADLARGPDRKMWVLGDRTQAPSGAGYALENRLAMSRVLPSLFRDNQVHRLARFFQSLRAGLNAVAPKRSELPRVVVLTPGPLNETFFEHAYLAAYLGYALVQGDDLTVRDGCVWLKSLTGLQRVDVILRRVDDNYCDPLELREDSRLGVPGLLDVVRRGNVAIANPLGSGVLENPGLMAFLPGIAEYFLGQPLKLNSIATWWCGQSRELSYVLANLPRLVIKPIYRKPGEHAVFGHKLSRAELAAWRQRIQARPAFYVGQEYESFSTAPSLADGCYQPRQSLLRCFMVARADGYTLMPGGLTRSAHSYGEMLITNQMGSISKDTWVIASEPQLSSVAQAGDNGLSGHANALPSRAADNIFWVGRNAERAEGGIRLIRATIKKLFINPERDNPDYQESMHTLLRCVTGTTGSYPGFFGEDAEELLKAPEAELLVLATDADRIGSLPDTINRMAQSAYAVRDLWSSDTWRVVDEIEEQIAAAQRLRKSGLWSMQEQMDQLVTTLSAFSGLAMESMTRGDGWLFLDIGRRLERGLQLVSLLRTAFAEPQSEAAETRLIESLLDSSDNLICYRQHYRANLELTPFLELLLLDPNNPRSLAYQIARLQEHVGKLPREAGNRRINAEERLLLEASCILHIANIEELQSVAENGKREALDSQLGKIYGLLANLSETLTATYFRHGDAPQSLS
ncbi:circularly permuted type 2 ATP-grasp protein [Methylomonas sp. SURF-1]|uniref:Circularly permuted type 2 ATP-grasp protein n=1 Tax=Methylomonas aurea TaxID=2952224 RepID=A0ABT1UHH0_9GAMM|nr:circularly permuted type 2 ATP-grasp protein [Methylomonas sp. SURF-1]MCQ8181466.1 circularly permuted type 2 ATP-grasp protein [Methylomonas sp. SURF-1]